MKLNLPTVRYEIDGDRLVNLKQTLREAYDKLPEETRQSITWDRFFSVVAGSGLAGMLKGCKGIWERQMGLEYPYNLDTLTVSPGGKVEVSAR